MKEISKGSSRSVLQIVRSYSKQDRSVKAITKRIRLENEGLARFRAYSEEDYQVSKILLATGGPRALHAAHVRLSLPSVRSTQRHFESFSLQISLGFADSSAILHNLHLYDWVRDLNGCFLFALGSDEFHIDGLLQYDPATGFVLGFGREVAGSVKLRIDSVDDLRVLERLIAAGVLESAFEVQVFWVNVLGSKGTV